MIVYTCTRCRLQLTDERQPLDSQRIPNCGKHPARAKGWRGATPHDWTVTQETPCPEHDLVIAHVTQETPCSTP